MSTLKISKGQCTCNTCNTEFVILLLILSVPNHLLSLRVMYVMQYTKKPTCMRHHACTQHNLICTLYKEAKQRESALLTQDK